MKKKWLSFFLFIFLLTAWVNGQTSTLAPDVLTGKLPDGLTYFIQKNSKPVNRVQLSLIVHTGSVQEKEDEKGLAHLLEHMEFQGTEHFGPHEIVNFLEKNGMKFGADLNASTGFTSTQYYLELPTDKPEIFHTGLQILEDWAKGPKIDSAILENEKKVVMEEARLRMNNVRGRVSDFEIPVLYGGSKYAERLPIGSMEIVKNVTPEKLEAFCHTWYEPNNMAIAIVGDIDPNKVLNDIRTSFVSNIRQDLHTVLADEPVPDYNGRIIKTFQDKELATSETIWVTNEKVQLSNYEKFSRFQMLNDLLSRILNNNLSELARSAKAPFQDAGLYGHISFGNSWEREFALEPFDNKIYEGIEAFSTELERARSNGFNATDFRLAVSEMKSQIEAAYAQRAGITNEDRVSALASYFLQRIPAVGDEAVYSVGLRELGSITLEELNIFAKTVLAFPDFRMVVMTPEKNGLAVTDVQQISDIISKVQNTKILPAQERTLLPLMDKLPEAGKIVSEKKLADLDVTVYSLENGIQVMAKKTAFTPNEVLLRGQRLGGLSLVEDKDYLSVSQAPSVFSQTGLGRLNQTQLSDFLSGKQVQLQVNLGSNGLYFNGSSTKTDLETLFQMLHEQMGPVHRDADTEKAWLNQTQNYLENTQGLPATAAQNEINRLTMNGNVRSLPLTTERLKEVNLDRAAQVYEELLKNPKNLVLAISGDFDELQLRSFIEIYLGSIESGTETRIKDLGIRPASGPVRSVVAQGTDDKAENTILIINPKKFNPDDRFAANILREILDINLREVLRNQNGGTYDAESGIALTPFPYPQALVEVMFTCEPSRQADLVDKALAVLDELAQGKLDTSTFEKAKAIQVRGVEAYLNQNAFWSGVLPEYTLKGYDLSELSRIKELYQAVTQDQILNLAKEIVTTKTALQVILKPKE